MNVLVTGGAGFVGSNLLRRLISMNYNCFCLDNYSSGSHANHVDGVHYTTGTTEEIDKFYKIDFDFIFHLGEYSRVEQSFNHIDRVFASNVSGTQAVIEFCERNKTKLIYAGSSTKFSLGTDYVHSPYSLTKKINSELISSRIDSARLNACIVYFYNVFGDNEIYDGEYATVIGIFKRHFLENKRIPVVLPGDQMRNFTHVDDIVDGLIRVALNGVGDGYCIGNPAKYSILDVAKMFSDQIAFLPARKGNRMDATLDLEKMENLGWKARISLPNYIENWIENGNINK